MTLPVFPAAALSGLLYPVLKSHEFNTLAQDAANLMDTRIAQTYNPRWHWEQQLDFVRDDPSRITSGLTATDYRTLEGFFLSLQGKYGDFLFSDPSDNSVGPAMLSGSPNLAAELQLVNDGAGNYYSPIQRNFGGQFYEDITDLDGSIVVYQNGVLTGGGGTAAYTVGGPGLAIPGYSFLGLYLAWASEPTGPITAQFDFYFRVHMEEDSQDMEQISPLAWTVGGSESKNGTGFLKFCSSRIPQI